MYTHTICTISIIACATLPLRASDPYAAYTNALTQIAICETNATQRDIWVSRAEKAKLRVIEHAQQNSNYLTRMYLTLLMQQRCSSFAPRHERLFRGFLAHGLWEIIRECSPALAYRALLAISQQSCAHEIGIDTVIQMLAEMALANRGSGNLCANDIWTTVLSYTNNADASARSACVDALLRSQRIGKCPLSSEAVQGLIEAEVNDEQNVHTRVALYKAYIAQGNTNLVAKYEAWLISLLTNTALSAHERDFVQDQQTHINRRKVSAE